MVRFVFLLLVRTWICIGTSISTNYPDVQLEQTSQSDIIPLSTSTLIFIIIHLKIQLKNITQQPGVAVNKWQQITRERAVDLIPAPIQERVVVLDVQIHSVPGHQLQDGRVTSGTVTSGGVAIEGVDVDVIVVELHPRLLSLLSKGVVVEGVDTSHWRREDAGVDVKVLS